MAFSYYSPGSGRSQGVLLSARHVLQSSTAGEFQSVLDALIESCVAFKLADPHVVPPVRMDRDALRSAAEVTEAGVELDTVIARFANDVLPACLNFSAPTFVAHPDAGNSTAGILGGIANVFLQQNLSSFDYSPAATVLETELLRTIRGVIGYPVNDGVSALSAGGGLVFGGAAPTSPACWPRVST